MASAALLMEVRHPGRENGSNEAPHWLEDYNSASLLQVKKHEAALETCFCEQAGGCGRDVFSSQLSRGPAEPVRAVKKVSTVLSQMRMPIQLLFTEWVPLSGGRKRADEFGDVTLPSDVWLVTLLTHHTSRPF